MRPKHWPGRYWEQLGVPANRVFLYEEADIEPPTYAAYQAILKAKQRPTDLRPDLLRDFLDAGLTPDQVGAFIDAGITHPSSIVDLHCLGCTPEVARDWIAAQQTSGQWNPAEAFAGIYRRLADDPTIPNLERTAPIRNALLQAGGVPDRDHVIAWQRTGLPADRIALLAAAGLSPAEATQPPVPDMDETTLRGLATLHRRERDTRQ